MSMKISIIFELIYLFLSSLLTRCSLFSFVIQLSARHQSKISRTMAYKIFLCFFFIILSITVNLLNHFADRILSGAFDGRSYLFTNPDRIFQNEDA